MIIGLTGGIGSGKSLAASYFLSLGIPVIDADAISRNLTGPGGEACPAIAKAFGPEYIAENGALNRALMRDLVFSRPESKKLLEDILHPLIHKTTQTQLLELQKSHKFVIYDCPLLTEKKEWRNFVDRVLVIDVDTDEQIKRVVKRNGLKPIEVIAIINNQASRKERIAIADDIIYNGGSTAELETAVKNICNKYFELTQ